jgi:imidazolonepropionase-like amidohydrolase
MPEIEASATPVTLFHARDIPKSLNSKEFVVSGARVWKVEEDALGPLSSFLYVRDGRILAVGDAARDIDPDIPRIDLPGRVLVPGLIDAHVHLELDPGLRTPAEQLAVPEVVRRSAMARRAAAMLAAGITTARDCGGGQHLEHSLRDTIRIGECVGPRLLCCGQPVTTPGGHCSFWGGEVETRADIDRLVARQVEAKSDWIKVMATGGVFTPGSRARDAQFDLPGLVSVVESAGRAGRSVAAHCHGTEGIANAVRAGVRTIEHASFAGPEGFGTALDDALMREMAEAEVWVSPTVNAGWGRRITDSKGEPSDFFRRMSALLRAQRDHGIRFIASTDAGIPGVVHDDLVSGMLAFAQFADLRPVDVLRAATSEAANALGLAHETGRISVGLSADFLVLEGNPLDDLAVLRDSEVVVSRGDWFDRARRERLDRTVESG